MLETLIGEIQKRKWRCFISMPPPAKKQKPFEGYIVNDKMIGTKEFRSSDGHGITAYEALNQAYERMKEKC